MKKPTKKLTRAMTRAMTAKMPEDPELEAVAARAAEMETAAAEAAQDVFADPEPPPPPEPDPVPAIPAGDPGVTIVAVEAVRSIGDVATRLARVAPLTDAEGSRIGAALVQLLEQYDMAKLDPRLAAWIALGFAYIGVVLPRAREVIARRNMPAPAPVEHDATAGA